MIMIKCLQQLDNFENSDQMQVGFTMLDNSDALLEKLTCPT